ncbi:ribonuclease BN (tRNA processing enzyme) [Bradyrhizobium sp. GM24.11]
MRFRATRPCPGLERLAEGADLLVQACFLAMPEINNDHFRRLAKYTLACGDTVGKSAANAGVKKLALTHHRPRTDDTMLSALLADVRWDCSGPVVLGEDLTRIEV